MIAPGIRVVRGPDWIWQNQGEIMTHAFDQPATTIKKKFMCASINEGIPQVRFPSLCYQCFVFCGSETL